MRAHIRKWGNSQGVRIPVDLLAACGLAVDAAVDLQVDPGTRRTPPRLVITAAAPEVPATDATEGPGGAGFAEWESDADDAAWSQL